jgi:glycosyl transferase family 11
MQALGGQSMIIVCLRGGLGNQLFEYAFGRFLAHKHGTELRINRWFYTSNNSARFRPGYDDGNPNRVMVLLVDHFNIFCEKYSDENWQCKEEIANCYPSLKYVTDNSSPSIEEVARLGENLILCGWWSYQTDYLFEKQYMDVIRPELTLKCRIGDAGFEFAKRKIENSLNSVAVHVRRGDYKDLQHIFTLLPEDYYKRAFNLMEVNVSTPEYFVFSDEIDEVQRHFRFSRDVHFVKTNTALADFELMRRCRHNIIANSTFSWWAAYLNANEDKIVITPATYYGNKEWQTEYERQHLTRGYMPSTWLKI